MSQNDTKVEDAPATAADKAKDRSDKVADYLQSPRRKRKSFVLMALGPNTSGLGAGIESYVRSSHKGIALAQPRTAEELLKNFSRQVVLMVFDDEFVDLEAGLELMEDLKRRKNQAGVPILFLTRQPERLVTAYNKKLKAYHESDDYVAYHKSDLNLVLSKVKAGLTTSYRRRSRRYSIDIPLDYHLLADEQQHAARVIDLSIHGALLKSEDDRIFREGEQLNLSVPVGEFLRTVRGDFMNVAAKVRRVFIGGTQAGVSFEHLSDNQLLLLTRLLTGLVNDDAARKTQSPRARSGR